MRGFFRALVGKGEHGGSRREPFRICAIELANYLGDQAVVYRKLAEQADDPFAKNERPANNRNVALRSAGMPQ